MSPLAPVSYTSVDSADFTSARSIVFCCLMPCMALMVCSQNGDADRPRTQTTTAQARSASLTLPRIDPAVMLLLRVCLISFTMDRNTVQSTRMCKQPNRDREEGIATDLVNDPVGEPVGRAAAGSLGEQ
jgi:hypothetical protein